MATKKTHSAAGAVAGTSGQLSNGAGAAPAPQEDNTKVVDQDGVTSKVSVSGATTKRTYSDGAVQINTWPNEEAAQSYAASVRQQEGAK